MSRRLPDGRVLIAGAGIGGLSAAIALARAGIRSQVLERSRVISTDGAGIQLGPNATRILAKWGVLDTIMETAVQPEAIDIRDGRSGKTLASAPLGAAALERYGAPYIVTLRADLHRALIDHARNLDAVMLRRHFGVDGIEETGGAMTVSAADGATAQGDLLIGADGLWSRVRKEIAPRAKPRFSGKTAWRTLIDASALPARFREPRVGLWMAPTAHVVHYPVSGGAALNLVAVIGKRTTGQAWNAPGDAAEIAGHFHRWPEDVRRLIEGAEAWRTWPLADLRPLKHWSRGTITLLGDAAHPVLPFLAQGGALAIEDADVLASLLGDDSLTVEEALQNYERARIGRAAAVRSASRKMGRVYHMGGVSAAMRNLALRLRRPKALLARHDWLYRFGEAD